ncbi:hypothetical protein LOK49_LG01G02980 [Camellia lanceoleosa]|uniref:Uncharacterized protein n=1 Tax=Camellia lanceoleosa TaxID=1840588 RepID=A0ACC0J6D0_9ERIC|nr:hypothetical protein LOK49_LG01G02980 [Camellia lanceoleosa]
MFRALSTRGGCGGGGGYERLVDGSSSGLLEAKLNRVTSLPAKLFGSSSTKLTSEFNFPAIFPAKQAKKVSKIHPWFGLFDRRRRRKKATAKPEVARYLDTQLFSCKSSVATLAAAHSLALAAQSSSLKLQHDEQQRRR